MTSCWVSVDAPEKRRPRSQLLGQRGGASDLPPARHALDDRPDQALRGEPRVGEEVPVLRREDRVDHHLRDVREPDEGPVFHLLVEDRADHFRLEDRERRRRAVHGAANQGDAAPGELDPDRDPRLPAVGGLAVVRRDDEPAVDHPVPPLRRDGVRGRVGGVAEPLEAVDDVLHSQGVAGPEDPDVRVEASRQGEAAPLHRLRDDAAVVGDHDDGGQHEKGEPSQDEGYERGREGAEAAAELHHLISFPRGILPETGRARGRDPAPASRPYLQASIFEITAATPRICTDSPGFLPRSAFPRSER